MTTAADSDKTAAFLECTRHEYYDVEDALNELHRRDPPSPMLEDSHVAMAVVAQYGRFLYFLGTL